MLAELEQRLAVVLGQRLPAPFTGRVAVLPDTPNGAGPVIQVAIGPVSREEPDIGSFRGEMAPGVTDTRRVARLSCQILITVAPGPGEDRAQTVDALDALLYLLDDPQMRSAQALREPGDPGFLLEDLTLHTAHLAPSLAAVAPPDLVLDAVGWFWPVGTPGLVGGPIEELRIRQISLPIDQAGTAPRIVAGGGPVELRFVLPATGTLVVEQDAAGSIDFGRVAVTVRAPDGGAGAGSLSGGQAGADGARLIAVVDNAASVTYQPPPGPARDRLVLRSVFSDAGETHFGPVLAAFDLVVEAGP